MKTPQEIAAEAVSGVVRVESWRNDSVNYVAVGGDENVVGLVDSMLMYRERAQASADDLRLYLVRLVRDAVEQALTQCPVPPGVSEEKLGCLLHAVHRQPQDFSRELKAELIVAAYGHANIVACMLVDAVGHIDHLHRIMHTPESQAIAEAYDQGRRDQRASDVEAAEAAESWDVSLPINAVIDNKPGKKS